MPGTKTTITEPAAPVANQLVWTPLRIYLSYRVVVAVLLIISFLGTRNMLVLGSHFPQLFLGASLTHLALAIAPTLLPQKYRPSQGWPALILFMTDIVLLTLLIHASGGIGSSLTGLMIVTVAAAGIILRGRRGLMIAAMATLAMMFEQFYFSLGNIDTDPFQLTGSAVLGISFFIIALITQQLAQLLERTEDVARVQRKAISKLEALSQQVVERMRTGVIIFDEGYRVLLTNRAASALFTRPLEGERLPDILVKSHRLWLTNPLKQQEPIIVSAESSSQQTGFAALETDGGNLNIAFLEDHARVLQQAQQIKLAALGRMSATIAHEIRNPLSAIHHAADLLESEDQSDEDRRLMDIIRNHVNRVNTIIDNVSSLSRRAPAAPQLLPLHQVIDSMRARWIEQGISLENIELKLPTHPIAIRFDPSQLEQILDNLINNARRHGGNDVHIDISAGVFSQSGLPWLDIRDYGPGVAEDCVDKLFEPFFTTSRLGSGLGLFICRELCDANQARLDYRSANPGASFVITFAHPDRMFN